MIGAIDIGGTKIAAGIVDQGGKLISHTEFPTSSTRGVDDAVDHMVRMLETLVSSTGVLLEGVGVGCTGPVYPELGTIGNVEFMPGWEGANLVHLLATRLSVPVAIENDADAAALGEWAWGAGRGAGCFLLVTVGTGIGAGLVLDGRLYRGVNAAHPEIGHHVIDPSGPLCFCGAHGCWEVLASGPAMERWAQAQHPQAPPLSAREICTLAEQGDENSLVAVKRTRRYLAIGLANLVTLYTPECIALGGGLMQSFSLFEDEIRSTIKNNCGLVPHERVHLVQAALGARSGLVGAARVWLHRFGSVQT
jgi:glucokinase